MSRVRANSSGTNFRAGLSVTASKSWADLSMMGMTASSPVQELEGEHVERNREIPPRKRVFSDGSRRGSDEIDDSLWDNRCA